MVKQTRRKLVTQAGSWLSVRMGMEYSQQTLMLDF